MEQLTKALDEAFIIHLDKQGIKLTEEKQKKYFNDFKKYCEEMEFTTEEEVNNGALEYVMCQVHYGVFQ
ncbi:hypothetical protein [Bacillus licheniformis]|uniref:hypothetical protein n=1 Tax=Bacillus licheniformis TaxID=1402 RepID=UPI002E217EA7|nr:hypothetical protein [Bacillus licheniformis]